MRARLLHAAAAGAALLHSRRWMPPRSRLSARSRIFGRCQPTVSPLHHMRLQTRRHNACAKYSSRVVAGPAACTPHSRCGSHFLQALDAARKSIFRRTRRRRRSLSRRHTPIFHACHHAAMFAQCCVCWPFGSQTSCARRCVQALEMLSRPAPSAAAPGRPFSLRSRAAARRRWAPTADIPPREKRCPPNYTRQGEPHIGICGLRCARYCRAQGGRQVRNGQSGGRAWRAALSVTVAVPCARRPFSKPLRRPTVAP